MGPEGSQRARCGIRIGGVMLMLVGATIGQVPPRLHSDSLGNLAIEIMDGRNLSIRYMDAFENPTTSTMIVTQTMLQSLTDTINAMSARISALEARTNAPTPVPTTGTPTSSPTTLQPTILPTTAAPSSVQPTNVPTAAPTCPLGPSGNGVTCAQWVAATDANLVDVSTQNCAVVITTTPALVIAVTAQENGCGSAMLGSSMGVYLSGAWTKISYTTTYTGRTSCFTQFGGNQFNFHEHSDNNDWNAQSNRASLNYVGQLGAEGGGLYPLNLTAGDTLSQSNFQCPDPTASRAGWTCTDTCSNAPHPWYFNTASLRQANVTLRRRFNLYANGVAQYADLAGPALGVSCANANQTGWTFSNIMLLI